MYRHAGNALALTYPEGTLRVISGSGVLSLRLMRLRRKVPQGPQNLTHLAQPSIYSDASTIFIVLVTKKKDPTSTAKQSR